MASDRTNNMVPVGIAKSNAGNDNDVVLWADPTTHRLLVDVSGGGGTSMTDDAAFTPGTTTFTPVGGEFDDTSPDSVDEGDGGAFRMSARRELYVQIRDAQGNERGLRVDANGAIAVTGAGAGTQYNEDDAHTTGDKVTGAGVVRKDTAASLAGTDGDYTLPIVDASGKLWVNAEVTVALPAGTNAIGKLAANSGVDIGDVDVTSIIPGTGATNLGKAIDTATGGTDTGVLTLATRDDALSALTPIEGDNVQLRVDANGALWTHDDALDAALSGSELQVDVVASLPAGTNAIGKLAANSGVDIGDVDVTSIIPGTGATNLGKAEDAAHTTGDTGVMALTVRQDTAAALGGTDADYQPLITDASGRLHVNVGALPASTNTIEVVGDVAHDVAAAGNPVAIAARATNSIEGLTQVANADATYIAADLNGALIARPHTTLEEILTERVSNTDGASTAFTTFAAGGAGIHNYITTISIFNSSATDGYVDFRDGTAGSIIFTAPAPKTGGSVITFPVPLKFAANTAVAFDVSGALTTVYISIVGFQAQG